MCCCSKGEPKIRLAVYQCMLMYIKNWWPGTKDIGQLVQRERQQTWLADPSCANTRPGVGKYLTQSKSGVTSNCQCLRQHQRDVSEAAAACSGVRGAAAGRNRAVPALPGRSRAAPGIIPGHSPGQRLPPALPPAAAREQRCPGDGAPGRREGL